MIVDIPFQEYRRLDRANASTLWRVLENPRRARWELDNPTTPIEAMKLGTTCHGLITGKDMPVVRPATANRRSNEGKRNLIRWLEETTQFSAPTPPLRAKSVSAQLDYQIHALEPIMDESGIQIVSQEQMDTAEQMLESLMSKPVAKVLFADGQGEVTCLQKDMDRGLHLKCRWDWLPEGHQILLDVKTTRSAAYEDFSASCARYGYHLQAAFYSWLYELEYGVQPAFFFAVVENTAPFDSAIFEADDDLLEHGRRLFQRALDIYAECKSRNFWPGADWDWDSEEYVIQKLSLPRWAK